ncbi:MAG: Smr/MutS family protein [Spirochaetaceae bacterium]|jgi:DNA-nicking Smr family endonuclease|nr:Smr/MutS family protein [Spirochaetaceae bacterium]
MDFGDILEAWERQAGKPGDRKPAERADSPPGRGKPPIREERVDPLTAWLRINGVEDKDRDDSETSESAGERRRRLLRKKPDGTLDLHGLGRDDAWAALETFFDNSRRQGFEKVLVVHGKGNHSPGDPVLKAAVRKFIEACPFAGESGQGGAVMGGSGSVWVLLKESGKTGEDQRSR